MVGSFSEDAISKFRDAMLNAGQQTNMPSRGQPSTFGEVPKGATRRGVSQSSRQAQVGGNAVAHNKQVNAAGRKAQMKNLQKIHMQQVNPG